MSNSDEILALYADGPSLLASALSGISEANLDLALNADSWSIRQIVHHLADGDDIWKMCIKAALGNRDGVFSLQWYWEKPQLEWSENWNYAHRSIDLSLALLSTNRRHILDLLEHTADAMEKSIRLYHPQRPDARITVLEVIEMQAEHIPDHIKDIQAIRQVHNV